MGIYVYCRDCGREIHETTKSYLHCGTIMSVIGNKNRIAAALLAFFLGGIGVHKFYLGKIWQGVLYLLFCWTFIPTFIAFIEFIVYLCTSDEKFARKYG